jgi:hypothetical protein
MLNGNAVEHRRPGESVCAARAAISKFRRARGSAPNAERNFRGTCPTLCNAGNAPAAKFCGECALLWGRLLLPQPRHLMQLPIHSSVHLSEAGYNWRAAPSDGAVLRPRGLDRDVSATGSLRNGARSSRDTIARRQKRSRDSAGTSPNTSATASWRTSAGPRRTTTTPSAPHARDSRSSTRSRNSTNNTNNLGACPIHDRLKNELLGMMTATGTQPDQLQPPT